MYIPGMDAHIQRKHAFSLQGEACHELWRYSARARAAAKQVAR